MILEALWGMGGKNVKALLRAWSARAQIHIRHKHSASGVITVAVMNHVAGSLRNTTRIALKRQNNAISLWYCSICVTSILAGFCRYLSGLIESRSFLLFDHKKGLKGKLAHFRRDRSK